MLWQIQRTSTRSLPLYICDWFDFNMMCVSNKGLECIYAYVTLLLSLCMCARIKYAIRSFSFRCCKLILCLIEIVPAIYNFCHRSHIIRNIHRVISKGVGISRIHIRSNGFMQSLFFAFKIIIWYFPYPFVLYYDFIAEFFDFSNGSKNHFSISQIHNEWIHIRLYKEVITNICQQELTASSLDKLQ